MKIILIPGHFWHYFINTNDIDSKMKDLLFENWEKLGQVALMTIASFVVLFLFIRISGKRTLAKFNAVVRQEGIERLDDVLAVVIELNGEISVIKRSDTPGGKSSLEDLDIPEGQ